MNIREKKLLIDQIKDLNHKEKVCVLKIIVDGNTKYTENQNGVLINMKGVSDETLKRLSGFVNSCIENKKRYKQQEKFKNCQLNVLEDIPKQVSIEEERKIDLLEDKRNHFKNVVEEYFIPTNPKDLRLAEIEMSKRKTLKFTKKSTKKKTPARRKKIEEIETADWNNDEIDIDTDIDETVVESETDIESETEVESETDIESETEVESETEEDLNEDDEDFDMDKAYNELSLEYENALGIKNDFERLESLQEVLNKIQLITENYDNDDDTDFDSLEKNIIESISEE